MAIDFEATDADRIFVTGFETVTVPMTMACWAYADSMDQGTSITPFAMGDSASATTGAGIYQRNTGGFWAATYTNERDLTNGTASTWQHLVARYESTSSTEMALNGTFTGSPDTTTFSELTHNRIGIGVQPDSTPFGNYNGKVAETAVWNVALTDAEVAALADGYSPAFIRPDEIIYYNPWWTVNTPTLIGTGTPSSLGNPLDYPHPRIIYPHKGSF